ncbi:MAG: hypothetical protein LOD92_00790, partial [Bacillales bacterium]
MMAIAHTNTENGRYPPLLPEKNPEKKYKQVEKRHSASPLACIFRYLRYFSENPDLTVITIHKIEG